MKSKTPTVVHEGVFEGGFNCHFLIFHYHIIRLNNGCPGIYDENTHFVKVLVEWHGELK